MSRSRSSFDVAGALAHIAGLAPEPHGPAPSYRGVSLVSFTTEDPLDAAVTHPAPPRKSAPPAAELPALDEMASAIETARRPPKLPDLSNVVSPVARCEKIVEWIIEATGAANVFLADAAGLPIAGAIDEADTLIATSGLVASAVTQLSAAVPGNSSSIFEAHVGEGPFFQLIGFHVGATLYLVGFTRTSPLSPRQAHAVRLACRHALGELAANPS